MQDFASKFEKFPGSYPRTPMAGGVTSLHPSPAWPEAERGGALGSVVPDAKLTLTPPLVTADTPASKS
jgi:hypothetical protein